MEDVTQQEQDARLLADMRRYKSLNERIAALQGKAFGMGRDLRMLGEALETLHLGHTITLSPSTILVEPLRVVSPSAETLHRSSFDLTELAGLLDEYAAANTERTVLYARLKPTGWLEPLVGG